MNTPSDAVTLTAHYNANWEELTGALSGLRSQRVQDRPGCTPEDKLYYYQRGNGGPWIWLEQLLQDSAWFAALADKTHPLAAWLVTAFEAGANQTIAAPAHVHALLKNHAVCFSLHRWINFNGAVRYGQSRHVSHRERLTSLMREVEQLVGPEEAVNPKHALVAHAIQREHFPIQPGLAAHRASSGTGGAGVGGSVLARPRARLAPRQARDLRRRLGRIANFGATLNERRAFPLVSSAIVKKTKPSGIQPTSPKPGRNRTRAHRTLLDAVGV